MAIARFIQGESPDPSRATRIMMVEGADSEECARLSDGMPRPGDKFPCRMGSPLYAAPYDDWTVKQVTSDTFRVRIPYRKEDSHD